MLIDGLLGAVDDAGVLGVRLPHPRNWNHIVIAGMAIHDAKTVVVRKTRVVLVIIQTRVTVITLNKPSWH